MWPDGPQTIANNTAADPVFAQTQIQRYSNDTLRLPELSYFVC